MFPIKTVNATKRPFDPVTVEPRVEELLASIRKAIDADLGELSSPKTSSNAQGTLMRGALREMRVSYGSDAKSNDRADDDISLLRDRIGRNRSSSAFVVQAPSPKPHVPRAALEADSTRNGIGRILSRDPLSSSVPTPRQPPLLRQSYVEELPPVVEQYAAPQSYQSDFPEPVWEEQHAPQPEPEYYQPAYAPAPPANALISPQAAYAAQNSFQQLTDALMSRAAGDRGLEGMTQDLLRGMLKTWLDDNLPQLVEKLVREEIERVARRGR